MNVYEIVTSKILAELEKGTVPWHKPWCSVTGGAFNRITRRPYSILNQMLLSHEGEYATAKQWISENATIRKGEHPEIVCFWKWPEQTEETDTKEAIDQKKMRPVLRYYRVYHVSQIDGVEPLPTVNELFPTDPIPKAEKLFTDYIQREGIKLEEKLGNEAFYQPSADKIVIPSKLQYSEILNFYSILAHECCHSTGHAKRLNRTGIQDIHFGSQEYSKEELLAEIGACCIMRSLGWEDTLPASASYVNSWLSVLNNNPKWIVYASSQAQKACSYILNQGEMQVGL